MQELPLNGRNVLNLIALAPSVVPQGGSEGSLTGKNVFAAGNYQIGGGTANQSASYFDGVTVQDSAYGNIVVLTPSPEAVEEFRVQTNNSSAEFGRFTGGVINIASRSGTNTFRGSLFEYHRNKALNSNTFFGERAGLDKPPFVQNNFGGSLGGPVLQDKLFFFASYEGYRNREGVLFRRTVPTAAMKRGDFSDYRNVTSGALVPIYDPWTQCGINNPGTGVFNGVCGAPGVPNRQQFPGNIIPAESHQPDCEEVPGLSRSTPNRRWPAAGRTEQLREERLDRRRQQPVQRSWRLQPEPEHTASSAGTRDSSRPTFRSTSTATARRNGDPYSPEHFITTQVMAGRHAHASTRRRCWTCGSGIMRWDYDRTPGQPRRRTSCRRSVFP